MRLATTISAVSLRASARAADDAIAPAPSTSARRPSSPPSAWRARATHTDAVDTAPRPMPVSRRTRRPVASASRKPASSVAERALLGRDAGRPAHLVLDLGLADHERVESGGDAEQVARARRARCAAKPAAATSSGLSRPRAASAARSGSTGAGAATAYSSVRLHVDSTAAAEIAGIDRSSASSARAAGSVSAARSRSATVAVRCESPTATSGPYAAAAASVLDVGPHRGHRLLRYSTTSDCSRVVSPSPKQLL